MNQKTLLGLLGITALLAVIYFIAVPGASPRSGTEERRLLDGIGGEAVAGVTLEQGAEKVELKFQDGKWKVPARGGYQADSSKIRAFLLKLFDLEVSQLIPADEKSAERLGVSPDSVKRGMGHVTLADAAGRVLVGIRLGEARKGKEKGSSSPSSGQYVRRDDHPEVYLIGTPVILTIGPESWIDVNLLNVLPSSIKTVLQAKRNAESEELLFELEQSADNDKSGQPIFLLKSVLPAGKNLQEPIVSQVRSALENFRISDVKEASAEEVKDLSFDFLSKYSTSTGLVYNIETAEKDQKFYARLNVAFDEELAKSLREAADKASSASASSVPAEGAAPQPSVSPTPVVKKPELSLSDAAEAKKLSEQLQNWVFEVPAYNARKLRFTMADLTEVPPPPPQPQGGEFMPNMGQ